MTWELVVPVPAGKCAGKLKVGCWSCNDDHRAHYYETSAHRAAVREAACALARQAEVPALGRVRLRAAVYVARPRAADPWNYASGSSVKAAVDGLVDAGVMPNDTGQHMTMAEPRMLLLGKTQPRVVLTIAPWSEEEGAECPFGQMCARPDTAA